MYPRGNGQNCGTAVKLVLDDDIPPTSHNSFRYDTPLFEEDDEKDDSHWYRLVFLMFDDEEEEEEVEAVAPLIDFEIFDLGVLTVIPYSVKFPPRSMTD